MATRFEFVLVGDDAVRLRAAGEEALDEIEKTEGQLSVYRSGSEIAQVNSGAANAPVRVSPPVFQLLLKARDLWSLSQGAFDITIGPLVRCWGFMKGTGARPTDEEIKAARDLVGMDRLHLDEKTQTVSFSKPGMMIDLGSIGKGYALDLAAEILRDGGVKNALLHGGTSTILAMGTDENGVPWKVAIEPPLLEESQHGEIGTIPKVVELVDQALSVSAPSGKFFVLDGKSYGHVMDARTGWPGGKALLGCAICDRATESDALSTAVLLADPGEFEGLTAKVSGLKFLQMRLDSETRTFQTVSNL